MKVGDKVICIKDRPGVSNDDKFNKSGEEYTIIHISFDEVGISVEKNQYHIICFYKYKNMRIEFFNFNEYFISLKEYRKQKLNKINENDTNI